MFCLVLVFLIISVIHGFGKFNKVKGRYNFIPPQELIDKLPCEAIRDHVSDGKITLHDEKWTSEELTVIYWCLDQ